MDDLSGLHIVVTRPEIQAQSWAERLRVRGALVTVISLLEITPVADEASIRRIKNQILDFDLYNKAIFVSQNAVDHGFEWIDTYWPQLPMGVEFFAVGDTTAKQLQNRGAPVTDLAQTQTGAMNSESLLLSPELQSVAGQKVLVFRGAGGRPHIGEMLTKRGAHVDYCELYERILPAKSPQKFIALLTTNEQPLIIVIHSGEALENLQKIIVDQANVVQIKNNIHLLVPGTRILELAKVSGFNKVSAAQNATEASMLQGLLDLKNALARSEKITNF